MLVGVEISGGKHLFKQSNRYLIHKMNKHNHQLFGGHTAQCIVNIVRCSAVSSNGIDSFQLQRKKRMNRKHSTHLNTVVSRLHSKLESMALIRQKKC